MCMLTLSIQLGLCCFCRVLIAYDCGLIILWDVVEARVVMVRGDKVLDLKDGDVNSHTAAGTIQTDNNVQNMEDKEISASCWASSNGSILAVGYIDGDILFWKTSNSSSTKVDQGGKSSNNVVRLQLSSAEKRLPVVVLHWSSNNSTQNDVDGHLFVYGGDEIGSDEVLTVSYSLHFLLSVERYVKDFFYSCTLQIYSNYEVYMLLYC